MLLHSYVGGALLRIETQIIAQNWYLSLFVQLQLEAFSQLEQPTVGNQETRELGN